LARKKYVPEDIFTPRSDTVNDLIYIKRPKLENALLKAIKGSKHVLIHGESGTGKSWLYKRVFKENNIAFMIANLANASRFGSISEELKNLYRRDKTVQEIGYKEKKKAGVSAVVASGGLEHESEYRLQEAEPFEACLQKMRILAGRQQDACLVLDNLETIVRDSKLMRELADIIILLDDPRYAQYKTKILVVGLPGDVHEYFSSTPNRDTVANRLHEIPSISRLTSSQCDQLVTLGFIHHLRFSDPDGCLEEIKEHVHWITHGIPQRVQEYCLELARSQRPRRQEAVLSRIGARL